MDKTFKVACIQNCATDDMEANISATEALVRAAASAGASLICLPEYFCILERSDWAYFDKGFEADQHPALTHFRNLAKELHSWLLLGSIPVKFKARKVHNRSHLIAPDGKLVAIYNKLHLFDVAIKDGQNYRESSSVAPGDRAVIADLPWGRLGLTICYDVRFPHLYRALAKAGAHFIAVPAAFTAKTGEAHWHTLVRARAIETRATSLRRINRVSDHGDGGHTGIRSSSTRGEWSWQMVARTKATLLPISIPRASKRRGA